MLKHLWALDTHLKMGSCTLINYRSKSIMKESCYAEYPWQTAAVQLHDCTMVVASIKINQATKSYYLPGFVIAALFEEAQPHTVVRLTDSSFRLAALVSGEFVLYKLPVNRRQASNNISCQNGRLVGQIIDAKEQRDIDEFPASMRQSDSKDSKKQWVLIRMYDFVDGNPDYDSLPRLNPTDYDNIPSAMKEVVMTRLVRWIPLCSIDFICWVFHYKSIEDMMYRCGGIFNAFFVRFYKMHGQRLYPIPRKRWNPFYCPFDAVLYSRTIFNCIDAVNDKVRNEITGARSSWTSGQKEIEFKAMPREFYDYLRGTLSRLAGNNDQALIMFDKRGSKSTKTLHSDLSQSNRKRRFESAFVRAVQTPQLDNVRRVMGGNFAMGLIKPAPKLGKPPVPIQNNDLVRIVSTPERSSYDRHGKHRVRCPDIGVDFRQDSTKACYIFSIRIVLTMNERASRDTVGNVIERAWEAGEFHWSMIDNCFEYKGEIYKIVSGLVNSRNQIQCQDAAEDEGPKEWIDASTVKPLVLDFYS